jgi:hypothetical protein
MYLIFMINEKVAPMGLSKMVCESISYHMYAPMELVE